MALWKAPTTKSEWCPDDPTAFAPTKPWKLPFITTWGGSPNRNLPTNSAEEAFLLFGAGQERDSVLSRTGDRTLAALRFWVRPRTASTRARQLSRTPSSSSGPRHTCEYVQAQGKTQEIPRRAISLPGDGLRRRDGNFVDSCLAWGGDCRRPGSRRGIGMVDTRCGERSPPGSATRNNTSTRLRLSQITLLRTFVFVHRAPSVVTLFRGCVGLLLCDAN